MGTNQNILLCQGQLLILAFISNLLSFRMFLGPYFCYCKSDDQKFSFLFFIVHPTQWSRRLFLLLYIFHNLPCIIWSLYYLWHLYQTYFSFFLPHAITILHLICFIQSLSVFAASSPQEGVKSKIQIIGTLFLHLLKTILWRRNCRTNPHNLNGYCLDQFSFFPQFPPVQCSPCPILWSPLFPVWACG